MNSTEAGITIGADVIGTDGRLGEVTRVIADAHTDTVTDIVVKHGSLLAARERVVPIVHVARVADGAVHLDLDKQGFERMDGFSDERHGPNPDYVGPPPADLQGTYRGNFTYDAQWAAGAAGAISGKPMGYPGGEQIAPDFLQRPDIAKGTAVLAADGEKVGEVGEFAVEPESGRPLRMTLRRGTLFKHEREVPLSWIQDLSSDGVVLNVRKADVDQHLDADNDDDKG